MLLARQKPPARYRLDVDEEDSDRAEFWEAGAYDEDGSDDVLSLDSADADDDLHVGDASGGPASLGIPAAGAARGRGDFGFHEDDALDDGGASGMGDDAPEAEGDVPIAGAGVGDLLPAAREVPDSDVWEG